ncbi:MAG TPA: phosphopantetheine-binding protein [Pyrinomonadaceae bacterium]|nr:phosphopantetheine-binding protein [Pyrinomonadaceae bacterium]
MLASDEERMAVRNILIETLNGGSYDIASLKEQLKDDSHFIKEIGIDSLDLLEFVLRLEEHFKMQIHDDDYASLTSIQAVAEFLKRKNVTFET